MLDLRSDDNRERRKDSEERGMKGGKRCGYATVVDTHLEPPVVHEGCPPLQFALAFSFLFFERFFFTKRHTCHVGSWDFPDGSCTPWRSPLSWIRRR